MVPERGVAGVHSTGLRSSASVNNTRRPAAT
jgi:hypothetical protein